MDIKAIVDAKIVLFDGIIENGVMIITGSEISCFGTKDEVPIPRDALIIDAQGAYAGPGFIDIHCHGGGGAWFYEDPKACAAYHLTHGTTGILATFDTLEGIKNVKKAVRNKEVPSLIGIQMEGPYTNPQYGSKARKARNPDDRGYIEMLDEADGLIKIWTLAPEIRGIDEFIETISKKDIIISVGHSEASPRRIFDLISKGLRLACHHMDATGHPPCEDRPKGTRCPGVDEAVLLGDDIYAEVIPDSLGIHVDPVLLKLIYKVKGPDMIVIITDATNYAFVDFPDNPQHIAMKARDLCFDEFGGLRGSRLTMVQACRNMMCHTKAGICEIFRMASYNPARLLGIEDRYGRIRKGGKANIVLVSDQFNLKKVIFEGDIY